MSLKNFHLKVNDEIELKAVTINDAVSIYELIETSRKNLEKYMDWVEKSTLESFKAYIKTMEFNSVYDNNFDLVILYKDKIVGICSFNSGDKFKRTLDLGYWISNEYARIGIVTKASQALINFAFSMTDTKSVYIKCEVTNKKSYAIAQRLGFEFVSQEKGGCFLKDGNPETVTYVLNK